MSTFVRIELSNELGAYIVNIDAIAYIDDHGDGTVTLVFSATDPTPVEYPGGKPLQLYLDIDDAQRFMTAMSRRIEVW